MKTKSAAVYLFSFMLLSGCAAMFVSKTSDPLQKLLNAENLYMEQYRPLPAEKLIREAIMIYQERQDPHGLGTAYREYGDLLRSPAVVKWEQVYKRDGFQDKTITFDNRFAKASEFYSKALEYYNLAEKQHRETGRYDALTNVYYNMARANYMLGDIGKACHNYDQTLEAYNENIKRNPTAKQHVSAGYNSVADQLASAKQRVGCK